MSAAAATVPVDQATRDRIRTDHGTSLIVEAGAGTGKTTALVERVVAMVASGRLHLHQLAAITFTEAAAAELRDRVRAALEAAADGRDAGITDDPARDRCRVALDELDDAAIGTLHGFAQRILAEHPIEAGLPPGFEVLDDIRARVEFDQHWDEFVERLLDDPALEPILVVGFTLGLSLARLRAAGRAFHQHSDRLDPPSGPPSGPPADRGKAPEPAVPPLDPSRLLELLGGVLARRSECSNDDDDKLAAHLDTEIVWLHDQLRRTTDPLDVLDLIGRAGLRCRLGRAEHWGGRAAEIRDLCEAADECREELLDEQRIAVLDVVLDRLVRFVHDYARERRREGRLEFHDLLTIARELLRDHAEARLALTNRYRALLLDEFQDTDPLQIQIAVLLTSDDQSNKLDQSLPWWEIDVAPGRLFVVGDPKQSIYRFRRADLGVYHRAAADLALQNVRLEQNFRSVPGVIDFVNAVAEPLFGDGKPGLQAQHTQLRAHRTPLGAAPLTVGVFGGPTAASSVAFVRVGEAAELTALVQRVENEGWPVVDPRTGSTRPATLRDVAILLPTRTALPAIEAALEAAAIPVRIESQSLVFSTAEVHDLLAILTAIDDPTDDIAVVAALRAPAFGCRDDELAAYARDGGRWDYRTRTSGQLGSGQLGSGRLGPDHPVVAGLASLHELHRGCQYQTVSETVAAVIRARQMYELAVAYARPRDHWRRLGYLLDQARAWDDAGDPSLRTFIEWVGQQADERTRIVESVAPEPDDPAVRILTVHGAKGLEFPIVVLAGLNVAPQSRAEPVLWGEDGLPQVRVGGFESLDYEAVLDRERDHEAAERDRLLYVAMTRARDYLLVSVHHKDGDRRSQAARLSNLIDDDTPMSRLTVGQPMVGQAVGPASVFADHGSEPASPPVERERAAWINARAAMLARAARPARVAATALAKMVELDGPSVAAHPAHDDPASYDLGLAKDDVDRSTDDAPPWRRGRAGTAIGRAVHAVLQTVDLETGSGLAEVARAQALAEGVAGREREIHDLVASVLAAPIVRAAVEGGWRRWREVPVAAGIDGVLVEGFVDLLVETPDGYVVVDYKTNQIPTDTALDDTLERYTVQGAAYALALSEVLGQPIVRCVFVFARRSGALERAVVDLPGAVDALRHRVAGLGAG